jgi:hypothetical protein
MGVEQVMVGDDDSMALLNNRRGKVYSKNRMARLSTYSQLALIVFYGWIASYMLLSVEGTQSASLQRPLEFPKP